MSYRYDKDKKNQTRWYIVGIVFMLLALFTPIYSWVFNLIEKPLARTWENQERIFTGTENFFEAFYGKQQILKENEALRNEVSRLEIDNLRTRYLSEELEKMYRITESDTTLITARVLKQGTVGSRDTFIINQGSINNVGVGDRVIAYDNVLVGIIDEVYDTTARVLLYSDTDQSINGVLFPHNINLTAQGYGKGSFLIETPREIEVETGDILYSLEEPGRIIALVREVIFDPRDPFKKVYLSYPVNIHEMQILGIKKAPLSRNNVE